MESSAQVAPTLLQTLRRGADEEARARAATLILVQGSSAVGTLLASLNDPDYDHPFIVELLGRIGDARAAPRLARLPSRRDDRRLADACDVALRRLGLEAVAELCAALADADCDVVWVANLLGELRDPWAIPALAGRLRIEKDLGAFEACLTALTSFGSEAASELGALLVTTTAYPARVVRAAVGIGDPRLAAALCARLCTETDPVTVDLCIAGLKQFGRDPIPDLIDSLHAPERDTQIAASILGKLRDARAVPALAKAVRIHPKGRAREWCLDALQRIGAPSVPALCELLAHPHPNAVQVVRALREIGSDSAVPAVMHRMGRSDEPQVVIACLNALGRLGDGTIIGALIEYLSDARPDVAPSAATAIASIAERHSFREAVVAVRAIRARLSILRRTSEIDRSTYRQAIERLESMASGISSLPMPASHRGHEDALPVPSQPQDVEPER